MGVAFLTPPSEHLRRRLIAGALALAINTGLVLGLALLPRTPYEPAEPDAVEIVLVSLDPPPAPPEPEPQPDIIVDPAPPPEPEAVPEPETPVPSDIPPEIIAAAPPAPTGAVAPEDEEEETPPPTSGGGVSLSATPSLADLDRYGVQALPETATNDTVREILCFATSEATRRSVACRGETGADGLPLLRYASPENRARGEAAFAMGTPEQIRALFGDAPPLGLDDLSGEPTLADTSQRPTAASDQMRDSLPPRHPDPAFGD